MGLYSATRRSCARAATATTPIPQGNPNPDEYTIVESYSKRGHLLVKINYPDCDNYEGDKILLFENVTLKKLLKQKSIDPHFTEEDDTYSPIARFEPTDKGWELGKYCLKFID